jgi:hypothetical protein
MLMTIVTELVALQCRSAVAARLRGAVDALDPTSPEASFIVARVVTSSPWRAADAQPGWTVATRLGDLLDRPVRGSPVTRLSGAWVTVAYTIISKTSLGWWQLLTPAARAALEAAGHRFPA